MIHGFSARMLERYLTKTNEAMDKAAQVHNRNPFEKIEAQRQQQYVFQQEQLRIQEEQRRQRMVWCSNSEGYIDPWGSRDDGRSNISERRPVPLPILGRPVNCRHPFPPENALGGRYSLGVGNSSNIVVDAGLYEDTLRKLNMVDDESGEDIYKTSVVIDEMCSNIYVVPKTGPRVKAITDRVKNSLGEYRSLTEKVSIETRKFVNEIGRIDQADNMFTFALEERSAHEVVNRVNTVMHQQADNMKNTVNGYRSAEQGLRDKANEARRQAQSFKMQIQQLQGQLNGMQSSLAFGSMSNLSANQEVREFYRQMRELERQMRDAERNVMSNSWRRF